MKVDAGSINVSVFMLAVEDVGGTNPGEPKTGLVFSDIETGGTAAYARAGAASVDITLVTLASASAVHTDGGFILLDNTKHPGVYRLDVPDAVVVSGVHQAVVSLVAAAANNCVFRPLSIDLDPTNFSQLGIAGDGDLTQVNALAGHTAQTGDSFARLGAPAGASVSADIALVEGQTDDIGVAGAGLTAINLPDQTMDITGNLSGSVGSVTGSVGSVVGHTAQTADHTASIASILADTNELQTDDIPASIAALNDLSTADVLAQVNAALDTAISELGVAAPATTPTMRTGLMLLYMALRNKLDVQTSGTDALEIHNDAGTQITSKLLTDSGGDYSEAKMT